MRLREITETRQVDEAFPIIGAAMAAVIPGLGGMTIGALTTAVFSVWAAIDLYQLAKKFASDPSSLSAMDWAFVVIDAATLKGPLKMYSAQARDKIFNMIPKESKEALGKAVKDRVMKDLEKTGAKSADDLAAGADDIYKPQPRRNRVDSVPSATAAPAPGAKSTPASPATPPKNPNLVDRPYQKEELLRLAGLAK